MGSSGIGLFFLFWYLGLKHYPCSISACHLNHCQTLALDVEVSIVKIKIEMDEEGKSGLIGLVGVKRNVYVIIIYNIFDKT